MDDSERMLRDQLVRVLQGGMAHLTAAEAVADFPLDRINERPPNVAYTPWHLLEHLRIAQRDILAFINNLDYREPKWPDDYWPAADATTDADGWARTIAAFDADFAAVCAIATDPQTDLYARIPWGEGQIILREILLVADHNAYHLGEFAILRQVMQTWPPRL